MRAQGDAVADREEFDTSDDIVASLADEDSVNLSLPDRVLILSLLGQSAIIGLECFFRHVFRLADVKKVTMYIDGL